MVNRRVMAPDQLYELLDAKGIHYEVTHHEPIFTVEQAQSMRPHGVSNEGQVRNLFLKNKKNRMCLLTLHETRKIDLNDVAEALGARRFSFCSPERLMRYLGVIPGAVSPFALLNDRHCVVEFYFDELLLSYDVIYVHPLDNSATLAIARGDLIGLLESDGHACRILPLDLGCVKSQRPSET